MPKPKACLRRQVKIRRRHLFEDMMLSLDTAIAAFPDRRTGDNTQYCIPDVGLGAFSIFYMQYPSFLSHQKMMEKRLGISNARTLFRVQNIPTPNHIRNLLDEVNERYLYGVFRDCFTAVKRSGHLEGFRVEVGGGLPGQASNLQLLVAMDGTQYFSSTKVACGDCSIKTHNRKPTYAHQMINPAIVCPGNDKVICLEPEFIKPQDGDKKQDCESKAGKRWLKKHGKEIAQLKVTVLGDDLYSRQPTVEDILSQGLNYILVCKPDSHKTLYEYLEVHKKSGDVQEQKKVKWNGKRREVWQYRWALGLPLKNEQDALEVNWCELTITSLPAGASAQAGDDTKETVFKNSFITNHEVTKQNVESIVSCGRARWKTENENNNTLKTKGYNLKHNYGHGNKHLSSLLATMNILAYLFHTLQELMSKSYRELKEQLPTRKMFWEHIRVVLGLFVFKEWEVLMRWIIKGLEEGWDPEEMMPGTIITKV